MVLGGGGVQLLKIRGNRLERIAYSPPPGLPRSRSVRYRLGPTAENVCRSDRKQGSRCRAGVARFIGLALICFCI